MPGPVRETMPTSLRPVVWLLIGALSFLGLHVPAFAQNESHHAHESIGWVPREILERPVPLRRGLGNFHEAVTTSAPQAQAFYDQGLNYLYGYDWIEAARSFHQALRLDSTLVMAYLGLSDVYVILQDGPAAHSAIEMAKSFSGKASDRERRRIEISVHQVEFLDDRDTQKYFAYRNAISDALSADLTDPALWILRGFADEGTPVGHGQGGTLDTIAFYETALLFSPDNSAVHHFLTHSLENLGRTQEALTQAEAYVRLAPAIPHAHHMHGHELRRAGRIQEAIQEFQKTDELENTYYRAENIPSKYDWHHAHNLALLALCYQSLGQIKAAEPLLREAFSLPAYTDVAEFNHQEWPEFLLSRGRFEEALKASQDMIDRGSWPMSRFAGHTTAGRTLLAMNRMADAKNQLNLAEREWEKISTQLLESLPNAGALQGEILLREGDLPQGEARMRRIVETIRKVPGPDAWSGALFKLQAIAQVARDASGWDLAEFVGRQMVEHDPSYAGGYYAVALAAEHRGDTAVEREQFATAEKLWSTADPDLPELNLIREKLKMLR